MNKIITLGDIFRNLETEEKAFKFLRYVKDMQEEIERQKEIIRQLDIKNLELTTIIKEVREKIESVQMLGLRSGKTFIATLLNDILEILDKENI